MKFTGSDIEFWISFLRIFTYSNSFTTLNRKTKLILIRKKNRTAKLEIVVGSGEQLPNAHSTQSYTYTYLHTYDICTQPNLETYACRFSGVAAFNFYAVTIFQASFGGGLLNPHLAAVITGTVQLLASALSGLLSDLIGRLPLLLLTSLLMSAALGGFGFYSFYRESITVWLSSETHSDWIPLLCVLTFVAAFSLGPNPISWLLVGEMYSLGKEVSRGVLWETTFLLTSHWWVGFIYFLLSGSNCM